MSRRPCLQESGFITLVIGLAALVFSLGTLISDMIRNRNLLTHNLQADGQAFHQTLLSLDRFQCSTSSSGSDPDRSVRCVQAGFFDPSPNSHGREILLQRAEYLEKRITFLLKRLNMPEFGYITPADYRALSKEELKDLNFEKAKYFIDKEVRALGIYRGHPGYVLRSIHADLMEGWYYSILNGKNSGDISGRRYFERAIAKTESHVVILPMKNYLVVFILQSEGCALWVGKTLFYASSTHQQQIGEFGKARAILRNVPSSLKLLHDLRKNQTVFESGQKNSILPACTEMFDKI